MTEQDGKDQGELNSFDAWEKRITDAAGKTAKTISAKLQAYVDLLVGICFIAMGFLTIYSYKTYGYSYEDFSTMTWLSLIIVLFGGTLMVFNPRRTFNTSIGLYALTMGGISFCSAWEALISGAGPTDDEFLGGLVSNVEFVVYVVMAGFTINLMISGLSYLRGRPRGMIGMMFKAAFLMAMSVFTILLGLRTGEYSSLADAFKHQPDVFIQIFMFFIFLNVMDTDEARGYNIKNRLSNSTGALRHTTTIDDRSYVDYYDAVNLCSPDFSGWHLVDDGGPAEWEYRFAIESKAGGSFVTVQKWKGHSDLFFTVSDHEGGSVIRATRVSAKQMAMSEDGNYFYIRGTDHFTITMKVRRPLSDYEVQWRKAE